MSFPFLSLPNELQRRVLVEHFRSTPVEAHTIIPASAPVRAIRPNDHDASPADRARNCISILLVNKFIHNQAQPLFLAESEFRVGNCVCWRHITRSGRCIPPIQNIVHEVYPRDMSGFLEISDLVLLYGARVLESKVFKEYELVTRIHSRAQGKFTISR